MHIMKYSILKSWFSHTFCIVENKVVLHNTNAWENHYFKNAIPHDLLVQFI